jgi:hypothetical protein
MRGAASRPPRCPVWYRNGTIDLDKNRAVRIVWEDDMAQWRWVALASVAVAMLAGGCRQDEQNRPLSFHPGQYQGDKPPPLTEQQNRQLTERSNLLR